ACHAGAVILLEIGADQGQAALALGQTLGATTLYQDYAGLDRIVEIIVNVNAISTKIHKKFGTPPIYPRSLALQ
ncbi:MAG TPA: hypothetical protein PKX07_16990, partial [Aggregatilineales bacterium]|nr:hypothetical protein [Aggregatilineales bacterium]